VSSDTASAPRQGVCRPQRPSHLRKIGWDVRLLTEVHGPLEPRERSGQVALAEGPQAHPPRGSHEARGVIDRLGDPGPFVPKGPALGERPQLGMALGEVGTRYHGGQEELTEALAAPRPVEGRHGLPEAVDGPPIVTLGPVDVAEFLVRQRVRDAIAICRGQREGTLVGGDGLVVRAHDAEMVGQKARKLSQSARVVEGFRQGLGLAEQHQDPPKLAERAERRAQGEPEIDGLLARGARLRQMRKGPERRLERPHSFAVGRPRDGLLFRLPAVRDRLVPHRTQQPCRVTLLFVKNVPRLTMHGREIASLLCDESRGTSFTRRTPISPISEMV
jgi:hypothetical protein